ncbi:DUF2791 family P-loop domain-containing protein [Pseudomonas aeruginosa]|nr:DUF2791 family P-loop domain-containing protein [Pseudomonas aeruginosa]
MRSWKRSSRGGAVFKAIRGEYGSGKTFASRWLREKTPTRLCLRRGTNFRD